MSGIEILGIAASVVQIADLGARLSVKLFTFSRKVKNADRHIDSISHDIAGTGAVLQLLGTELQKDASVRLCSPQAIEQARLLMKDCVQIFDGLNDAIDGKGGTGGSSKLIAGLKNRLKYPFLEPQIELLRAKLERLKADLLVMLNVLIYGAQLRSHEALPVLKDQQDLLQQLITERMASQKQLEAVMKRLEQVDLDASNSVISRQTTLIAENDSLPAPAVAPPPPPPPQPPSFEQCLPSLPMYLHSRAEEIFEHCRLVNAVIDEINHVQYRLNAGTRYRAQEKILESHYAEWADEFSPVVDDVDPTRYQCFNKHPYIERYWKAKARERVQNMAVSDGVDPRASVPAALNKSEAERSVEAAPPPVIKEPSWIVGDARDSDMGFDMGIPPSTQSVTSLSEWCGPDTRPNAETSDQPTGKGEVQKIGRTPPPKERKKMSLETFLQDESVQFLNIFDKKDTLLTSLAGYGSWADEMDDVPPRRTSVASDWEDPVEAPKAPAPKPVSVRSVVTRDVTYKRSPIVEPLPGKKKRVMMHANPAEGPQPRTVNAGIRTRSSARKTTRGDVQDGLATTQPGPSRNDSPSPVPPSPPPPRPFANRSPSFGRPIPTPTDDDEDRPLRRRRRHKMGSTRLVLHDPGSTEPAPVHPTTVAEHPSSEVDQVDPGRGRSSGGSPRRGSTSPPVPEPQGRADSTTTIPVSYSRDEDSARFCIVERSTTDGTAATKQRAAYEYELHLKAELERERQERRRRELDHALERERVSLRRVTGSSGVAEVLGRARSKRYFCDDVALYSEKPKPEKPDSKKPDSELVREDTLRGYYLEGNMTDWRKPHRPAAVETYKRRRWRLSADRLDTDSAGGDVEHLSEGHTDDTSRDVVKATSDQRILNSTSIHQGPPTSHHDHLEEPTGEFGGSTPASRDERLREARRFERRDRPRSMLPPAKEVRPLQTKLLDGTKPQPDQLLDYLQRWTTLTVDEMQGVKG